MSADDAAPAPVPVLRVVAGDPTAEELAALAAVLAAGSSGSTATSDERRPPSLWKASGRVSQHRPAPGPGAWRASGLPR